MIATSQGVKLTKPLILEEFAAELRNAFANAKNGADTHWEAVARRAIELASGVKVEAEPILASTLRALREHRRELALVVAHLESMTH